MAACGRSGGAAGLGAVAAASVATVSVLYWLIHGSLDWFWEFPALGGAAFAMLGLAAGLAAPPRDGAQAAAPGWIRRSRGWPRRARC